MGFRSRPKQNQTVRYSLPVESRKKQSVPHSVHSPEAHHYWAQPMLTACVNVLIWTWYAGLGLVPLQLESSSPPLHTNMHFLMTLIFFWDLQTSELASGSLSCLCFYVSPSCLLKYKSIGFTSIWSISSLSWLLTCNTIPDNDGDWHKAHLITLNPAHTKVSVLPLVTLLSISAFHVSLEQHFLNPLLIKIKQISAVIVTTDK